jgi:hypothetical protein
VLSEAAGEAGNTTAPATFIGSPMRCSPGDPLLDVGAEHRIGGVGRGPGVWMKVGGDGVH